MEERLCLVVLVALVLLVVLHDPLHLGSCLLQQELPRLEAGLEPEARQGYVKQSDLAAILLKQGRNYCLILDWVE